MTKELLLEELRSLYDLGIRVEFSRKFNKGPKENIITCGSNHINDERVPDIYVIIYLDDTIDEIVEKIEEAKGKVPERNKKILWLKDHPDLFHYLENNCRYR